MKIKYRPYMFGTIRKTAFARVQFFYLDIDKINIYNLNSDKIINPGGN